MSLNGLFGFFDYLIYLVQSTNRHGVHSPFAYDFADQVLYQRSNCVYEPAAELCRKRMIQSPKKISFTGGKEHSLGQYASNFIPSAKYNRLLFRWVQHQMLGGNIIEIGSSLGVLPLYLQRGAHTGSRYFICESNATLLSITAFNMREYDFNEIPTLWLYDGASLAIEQLNDNETTSIDLLVVNEYIPSIDFWQWVDWSIPLLGSRGAIVMNNINATPDSQLRWKQLQNHDKITLSIDLFGMGMAFARKEQLKESFLLRY